MVTMTSRRPWRRRTLALLSATALFGCWAPATAFAQSPPLIQSLSVQSGNPPTLVITGNNFGSGGTGDSVTVDGSPASVVTWSNTQITVAIPENAGPGLVDVTTPDGSSNVLTFSGIERGYYELSSTGTVTPVGNVKFYGDLSTLGITPSAPAVQLVTTSDGGGYWILLQNGTIYAFGDAPSISGPTNITAISLAMLPSGQGGYLLAQNGTVYPLGNAPNFGSPPNGTAVSAIAVTPSGQGYWVLAQNGTVYSFGDAANFGNAQAVAPSSVSTASTTPANPTWPTGSVIRLSGSSAVFWVSGNTLYHIPNPAVFLGMGYTWSQIQVVSSVAGYTLGLPMVVPYPSGSLLKVVNQPAVYLVQNGVLHHIASASVFLGMGYTWNQIQTVPALQPNWPVGPDITSPFTYVPSGSLYRVASTAPVYVAFNGALHHILSASLFLAMGYQWSQIRVVSGLPLPIGSNVTSPIAAYPSGTLLQAADTGSDYMVESGMLRPISSTMLQSLGLTGITPLSIPTAGGLPLGPAVGSTTLPAASDPPPSANVTANPAMALVPSADGQGYWILLQNGTVQAFGDAPNLGSPTASQMSGQTATALVPTPDGGGYLVITNQGQVFSYGDAWANTNLPNSTVAVTMASLPAGTFLSMAYGDFNPYNPSGSYQDLVQNGGEISVINPTWYYMEAGANNTWVMTGGPSFVSQVTSQAHSENIQVWPMIGAYYDPANGPLTTAQDVSTLVNNIVNLVQQNNFDGITIDFENSSAYLSEGMTEAEASQQYVNFVAQLGPALHAIGKKLMVDVYPAPYPYTIYNYSAIAPYVDYINIMDYPENSAYGGEAGPTSGFPYVQNAVQAALGAGLAPSQIILGVAPYGHEWTFTNQNGIQGQGDVSERAAAALLANTPSIVPVWDPVQKEEVFMAGPPAVAPTGTFSTANENTYSPQVANLQGLLNYILLRYAVTNNQSPPALLAQDGYFGPMTSSAVQLFQQDFNVQGATPGVYDQATQTALTAVINQWQIGQNQYWIDTARSFKDRLQYAIQEGLAGVAPWRLPFETPDYWTMLSQYATVTHN